MPATVTIRCIDQSRDVAAVWVGDCLAVHRPWKDGAPVRAPRCWNLTHLPTGLALASWLNVAKNDAIALAKAWDLAAACIDPAKPSAWRFLQAWRDDLQRVGIVDPWGPRDLPTLNPSTGRFLPDNPKPSDVAAAVAAAVGATYEPVTGDDAAAPFDPSETFPADRVRTVDGWPEIAWRGQWWPVPTNGEVETMVFDSLAETPDGRTVEPDHPESWPVVLGIT